MYVLLKMPFNPFDMEFYLFIEFLFYDPIAALARLRKLC